MFESVRNPGHALTDRAVNFIVKAAARRAGVNPAASVHWLRHAHASHAIDNGAPITLVSATLGHADLKTTSVYAHAQPLSRFPAANTRPERKPVARSSCATAKRAKIA